MEEKQYDSRYLAEIGYSEGKLRLPKGLIEGKELSLLIDRLTIPAHDIKNFHDFPMQSHLLCHLIEHKSLSELIFS